MKNKFQKDTIIIFDDIQTDLYFFDLVSDTANNFHVLKFKGKYIGISGL